MVSSKPPLPQYRAIAVVWLLVGQFLLQPLLAYWVTPHVARDALGQWVVMCTLNGTQALYVDFGDHRDSDADDEYCPALQLFQMAGSAQIPQPPQSPPAMAHLVGLLEQGSRPQHPVPPRLGFSPRAPPVA